MLLGTLPADPVIEFCIGVFGYIALDHFPGPLVIPDFLAIGADRQNIAQGLHFLQCGVEVGDDRFSFLDFLLEPLVDAP